MITSEQQFKKQVLRHLKKNFRSELWVYKSCDKFTAGIPDLIICKDGKFLAIELKYGDNTATKLQKYVINSIRNAGGVAGVAKTIEDVDKLIQEATSGRTN